MHVQELLSAALESEGLSGRTLRRLPFLAYAALHLRWKKSCSVAPFIAALKSAILQVGHCRAAICS